MTSGSVAFYDAMDDRNVAALDFEDYNLARLNRRLKMIDDIIAFANNYTSVHSYKNVLQIKLKFL